MDVWRRWQSEPVLNSATGESIGRVVYVWPEDLRETVVAASRGFSKWQAAWERGRIVRKTADILRADIDTATLTLTLEQGKPLAQHGPSWSDQPIS